MGGCSSHHFQLAEYIVVAALHAAQLVISGTGITRAGLYMIRYAIRRVPGSGGPRLQLATSVGS